MNKIIQEIAGKVKREIENNIIKILEGEQDLDRMMDSVGDMVNNIGLDTLSAIVGELNKHIKEAPERKGKYYVQRNNDERCLVTRFGLFEFERTYYKNVIKNNYIYILDDLLGIEKYERIEGNLKGEILEKSADLSYQKAAELSTPEVISRQSVKKIIRENGPIDNLELEIEEKKEVETIYIEADEDHVPCQDGRNREMKLIYVFDDKTKVNKKRIRLKNTRYFTGDMSPEDIWTEVADYIDQAYEVDKAKNIYIAGDGARWIKGGTEIIKGSKYVLDHYHLSKYVRILTAHLGSLENPVDIDEPLWNSFRNKNKTMAIELIDLAIKETPSKTKVEAMKRAKRYIVNNWEGIENLFGEKKYRCSAEGHVSHILSDRLSSRPKGWSIIGMDEMARMRAYKANGGSIKEYYRKQRKEKRREEKVIELDKRVTKRAKSFYNTTNPDLMIDIDYTSRTDGRWLKDMLNVSGF